MMHCHHGLQQPSYPSSRLSMTNISLDRTDDSGPRIRISHKTSRRESAKFNLISNRRARSVSFKQRHSINTITSALVGTFQGKTLAAFFWTCNTPAPIRRKAPSPNQGITTRPTRERIIRAHQYHKTTAFARQKAIRINIINAHLRMC